MQNVSIIRIWKNLTRGCLDFAMLEQGSKTWHISTWWLTTVEDNRNLITNIRINTYTTKKRINTSTSRGKHQKFCWNHKATGYALRRPSPKKRSCQEFEAPGDSCLHHRSQPASAHKIGEILHIFLRRWSFCGMTWTPILLVNFNPSTSKPILRRSLDPPKTYST